MYTEIDIFVIYTLCILLSNEHIQSRCPRLDCRCTHLPLRLFMCRSATGMRWQGVARWSAPQQRNEGSWRMMNVVAESPRFAWTGWLFSNVINVNHHVEARIRYRSLNHHPPANMGGLKKKGLFSKTHFWGAIFLIIADIDTVIDMV